jgi:hypothetical protein
MKEKTIYPSEANGMRYLSSGIGIYLCTHDLCQHIIEAKNNKLTPPAYLPVYDRVLNMVQAFDEQCYGHLMEEE